MAIRSGVLIVMAMMAGGCTMAMDCVRDQLEPKLYPTGRMFRPTELEDSHVCVNDVLHLGMRYDDDVVRRLDVPLKEVHYADRLTCERCEHRGSNNISPVHGKPKPGEIPPDALDDRPQRAFGEWRVVLDSRGWVDVHPPAGIEPARYDVKLIEEQEPQVRGKVLKTMAYVPAAVIDLALVPIGAATAVVVLPFLLCFLAVSG